MKPNLFDFATSELSHDAILSWMLSWGNNKENDLYNLSKDFIKLLTGQNLNLKTVDIRLEEENIDILALINNEIYIVIEDKLDTREHSDQLNRYKDIIDKKYPDMERHYAYITVGDEPSYDYILDKDYRVIERKDLINLIKGYKDKNDILKDYYNYLYKIEMEFNSSDNEDLDKWSYRGWQKFFINLNKRFKNGEWSWVNNQSGGFLAFYWDYKNYKYKGEVPYTIYMQVEDKEKIAFKVRVEDKEYRSEIRNFLWRTLDDLDLSEEIRRPNRFGNGRTMTFAEIRDYDRKDELYKAINLAEKGKRYLDFDLTRLRNKYNEEYNSNEEPVSFLDDIYIVNGSLPQETLSNNLILATNIEGEDLENLIVSCKDNDIYIFSDENSLYEFRDCLNRSKDFLEAGYNMVYIDSIKSQESSINILSYFYGRENLDINKEQLVFINQENEDFKEIENKASDSLFYIFRDYITSRDIEGFNIRQV